MSSIGPQLPPHLSKRKREEDDSPDSPPSKTSRSNQDEIAIDDEESDSDDGYGPSVPKTTVMGPTMPTKAPERPSIGPTLPPSANTNEISLESDSDDDGTGPAPPPPAATVTSKQHHQQPQQKQDAPPNPKRIMGPAPPPANLSERPTSPPNRSGSEEEDEDSEDDYGPALPGSHAHSKHSRGAAAAALLAAGPDAGPKRDDWMLAPPTSTGYSERDPTKIKARKFASGTSATSRPAAGAGGGVSSIWTETPEEKARRLADAVLGRGGDQTSASSSAAAAKSNSSSDGSRDKKRDDKIRAFTEQMRGKSLYEEHQSAIKEGKMNGSSGSGGKKATDVEEEDDPSKRAFDREKDMGLGMKITASQRKELLNRASDFGGRFQKGNYL